LPFIGAFRFEGNSTDDRRHASHRVKFLIDANGILQVTAREQRSGTESQIEVQPSYGLTDDQVENMILESFDSAEEDFRQRQIIEARNERTRSSPPWKREKEHRLGTALKRRKKTNRQVERALNDVKASEDYSRSAKPSTR